MKDWHLMDQTLGSAGQASISIFLVYVIMS